MVFRRPCRAATCRSLSARRSRCCGARGLGVREIARRVRRDPSTISRELRRNAATAVAARLPGLGRAVEGRAAGRARRPPSSSRTSGCASTCRSGSPGVSCATRRARSSGRDGRRGRAATSRIARIAAGRRRGARSRSPTGSGSTSPMMSRCGSATRRSTRRSTSRAAGAQAGAGACLRTGRRCGFLEVAHAASVGARHAGGDDQRAARRGRGPGRSRSLGRRPDHRARRSAIGTLVERTTRFTMLIHLPREEGYGVARA